MATAVLGLFAIVTTVFAYLALRKQSAETATLQQQFEGQRKVNQLQTKELRAQLPFGRRQRRNSAVAAGIVVGLKGEWPTGSSVAAFFA